MKIFRLKQNLHKNFCTLAFILQHNFEYLVKIAKNFENIYCERNHTKISSWESQPFGKKSKQIFLERNGIINGQLRITNTNNKNRIKIMQ